MEARRREVLDAATEVMWAKGYGSSSMSEIAREAGVVKGALYHYVESKEQMLYLIVKEVFDASFAEIDPIAELDLPPLERLATFVRSHVRFAARHRRAYLLCLRDLRHLSPELQVDVTRGGLASRGTLRRILRACREEGLVDDSIDLDLQVTLVLAGLFYVVRWLRHAGDDAVERMAGHQARIVVSGLASGRAVEVYGGLDRLRGRTLD